MNKTITEMQTIFNIANMRKAITGVTMDLDNLDKYDVYTMNENELFDMQDHLIPYYNKAIRNE
tara:strand:+ start:308 stop:496 length:189 start_codon:yes stop_codon:yes gene_type:complete